MGRLRWLVSENIVSLNTKSSIASIGARRHYGERAGISEMEPSSLLLGSAAMRPLLTTVVAAASLTPQRGWFERLALVIPGPAASRWLLLADAVCLVALGRRMRRPILGVSFALGFGFIALNGLGLALTDFYLALTAFHLAVGAVTFAVAGGSRWLGGGLIALTVVLGVLT